MRSKPGKWGTTIKMQTPIPKLIPIPNYQITNTMHGRPRWGANLEIGPNTIIKIKIKPTSRTWKYTISCKSKISANLNHVPGPTSKKFAQFGTILVVIKATLFLTAMYLILEAINYYIRFYAKCLQIIRRVHVSSSELFERCFHEEGFPFSLLNVRKIGWNFHDNFLNHPCMALWRVLRCSVNILLTSNHP